jgi:hypothetical protein
MDDKTAIDLARQVFEMWGAREVDPILLAKSHLKSEIREVF